MSVKKSPRSGFIVASGTKSPCRTHWISLSSKLAISHLHIITDPEADAEIFGSWTS
jgi:hypothetical protein